MPPLWHTYPFWRDKSSCWSLFPWCKKQLFFMVFHIFHGLHHDPPLNLSNTLIPIVSTFKWLGFNLCSKFFFTKRRTGSIISDRPTDRPSSGIKTKKAESVTSGISYTSIDCQNVNNQLLCINKNYSCYFKSKHNIVSNTCPKRPSMSLELKYHTSPLLYFRDKMLR